MSKLFSKENKEAFAKPLNLDHPILVQVLGICSALAVIRSYSFLSFSLIFRIHRLLLHH